MKTATILFPNQLFKNAEILDESNNIYLVEEYLFFKLYKFHKQKIAFHRASMKCYADRLNNQDKKVIYIDAEDELSDIRNLIPKLIADGYESLNIIDPIDNWLEKHIRSVAENVEINWFENPLFINAKDDLKPFFKSSKKKFYQTSFYKQQRKDRNILMTADGPEGGDWTYDKENRKKYPKDKKPPEIEFPKITSYHEEATDYVEAYFEDNYGEINSTMVYPIDHESAKAWFDQFLERRFHDFGAYEDAILQDEIILNHSVLSPLINVGLLDPMAVIKTAIKYAKDNEVPINSTEGFVRQILGWREFIRGIYIVKGTEERTKNFWNFSRAIPKSFYDGTTGIQPIDDVIKKVLKTGYAHHIERLMILGNFMMLCEFNPKEVYQWFMELFIDAYDWVMVPNVYGMSLYADGGLMSTKPYISSSNYIMKMSDYSEGDWQEIWDGMFWNFMDKHRDFFSKNPRLSMLIGNFDKMDKTKQERHLKNATEFFKTLDE